MTSDRQLLVCCATVPGPRWHSRRKLRVARGTVQNRLARLENDGTIVAYTVRLRPKEESQRIRCAHNSRRRGHRTDEVIRALRGDPAVGRAASSMSAAEASRRYPSAHGGLASAPRRGRRRSALITSSSAMPSTATVVSARIR